MENNLKRNGRIELSAENAEQGLAQLVLTVIELLRQLIEKHAIRRVDSGNLTDAQIEDSGRGVDEVREQNGGAKISI